MKCRKNSFFCNYKYYKCNVVNGSIRIENTVRLERFVLPHLCRLHCTELPCILFRNNSKLKSIWLPDLKHVLYSHIGAKSSDVVIHLEGDELQLSPPDIFILRYLSGDRLKIVNLTNVHQVSNFKPRPWYLYADSVLIYFTVAIIIVIIMNLIIGLVFFVKEIRLKKLEEKMVREMLQIRNTSIQAKLIRYNVEACQKKNPTKTFTEALAAVKQSMTDRSSGPPPVRPSRAALLDALANDKKTN